MIERYNSEAEGISPPLLSVFCTTNTTFHQPKRRLHFSRKVVVPPSFCQQGALGAQATFTAGRNPPKRSRIRPTQTCTAALICLVLLTA